MRSCSMSQCLPGCSCIAACHSAIPGSMRDPDAKGSAAPSPGRTPDDRRIDLACIAAPDTYFKIHLHQASQRCLQASYSPFHLCFYAAALGHWHVMLAVVSWLGMTLFASSYARHIGLEQVWHVLCLGRATRQVLDAADHCSGVPTRITAVRSLHTPLLLWDS